MTYGPHVFSGPTTADRNDIGLFLTKNSEVFFQKLITEYIKSESKLKKWNIR